MSDVHLLVPLSEQDRERDAIAKVTTPSASRYGRFDLLTDAIARIDDAFGKLDKIKHD
jgi:hypothetical protein